jgi:hypothetical protein
MKLISLIVMLVANIFLIAYATDGAAAHGIDPFYALVGFTFAIGGIAWFFWETFKPEIYTEQEVYRLKEELLHQRNLRASAYRELNLNHRALEAANRGIKRLRRKVFYWRNKAEGKHVLQSNNGLKEANGMMKKVRTDSELGGTSPATFEVESIPQGESRT